MIKINLNKKPKKAKISIETGTLRKTLVFVAIPVIVAGIVIFIMQTTIVGKINHLNKNIKIYDAKIAMLKPKVEKIDALKAQNAQILKKINIIKTLKREQMGPLGYIYYITSAIPRFSWINSLKSNNGIIFVSGIALDGQVESIFMNNLSNTGFFSDVTLKQTSETKEQGLKLQNFSLNMRAKGEFLSDNTLNK